MHTSYDVIITCIILGIDGGVAEESEGRLEERAVVAFKRRSLLGSQIEKERRSK